MAGVVGGDVGAGAFAGEILTYTPGNTPTDPTVIEALYHFNGSRHSFTAAVHVEQTGLSAVVTGVVTDGWLRGNPVRGPYTQIRLRRVSERHLFPRNARRPPRSRGLNPATMGIQADGGPGRATLVDDVFETSTFSDFVS